MKRAVWLGALLLLSVGAWGQGCVGECNVKGALTFGGVAGATLSSITVIPTTATSPVGQSIAYSALALFSDGSTADVTDQATWFVSPPGIASNTRETVACTAGGTVTVSAQLVGVIGNATLTCLTYRIVPQGDLTAYLNTPFAQQFSELGGTPPYNWSKTGTLPPGLTFTTGTSGGLLSGTPNTLGDYIFTVSDIDSSDPPQTDNTGITVHVLPQQSEDNRYCNSDETTNFPFPGTDGPATLPTVCNYTAIAATPASGTKLYVCPPAEQLAVGDILVAVPGCANAQTAGYMNFYNTAQAAMNAAHCGDWVQLLPFSDIRTGIPIHTVHVQNVLNESLIVPPTSCAWGTAPGGIWVTTSEITGPGFNLVAFGYGTLPPPGTQITPAWAGQSSIPGRDPYAQAPLAGIYVPMIRCPFTPTSGCTALSTPTSSAAASAWRFIGLEFTAPHGREPQGGTPAGYPNVAVCPPNYNGTPQCSPGYNTILVAFGCSDSCGVTGASHLIGDRLLIHACDDKSDLTCKDTAREALELQGGRHNSVIDSYIYGIKTMNGIGPAVESHGMSGGNVINTGDDFATKMVNVYLEGSSCDVFYGGGSSTSGVHTTDIEFRRLTLFKPLLWKVDHPSFPQYGGSMYDAWVNKKGAGYPDGAACSVDAPTGPTPVNATCHAIIAGGQVLDVIVDNPGSGYILNPHITIAGGTGATVYPLAGILNVKNHLEFKNAGPRVLLEAILMKNVWKGQSDQDAFAFSFGPKNADNLCPTCTVQDVTARYIFSQGSNRGGQLGIAPASRCAGGGKCFPDTNARISIHDVLLDAVNATLWISKKGAFDGSGGGCWYIGNSNPQAKAVQDISINHTGCITTSPLGAGLSTNAAGLALNLNCANTNALFSGLTFKNSYVAGGVKATALLSNGCFQCQGSCAGGSTDALNGVAVSDHLLPIGGGFYTKGQVVAGIVDGGGTYTVAPTSCSFTGGGFSVPATCKFKFSNGTVTSVYPDSVGAGYTSAPAVAFTGGTFSVVATAHTAITPLGVIASSKSWCFNNNILPTAAFNGETPGTPYPTTQGDPTNNTCSRHAGGGNVSVTTWQNMLFTNFPVDAAGNEIPTGDLRLLAGSPGHNAADDGLDVGPNIDLLYQYVNCQLSGGLTVCH